MKYILFDIIGQKSGCKYYDTAFYKQLKANGVEAEIHSNFSINEKPAAIINIYIGGKIRKIINLIRIIPVFIHDVVKHKGFIYMTYGEFTDCIFLFLQILFHSTPIVDMHEYICIDKQNSMLYKTLFKYLYKKIAVVIYHSQRSENYLRHIDFKGKMLFVPHFKYEFAKQYTVSTLNCSVREAIVENKINILFFGHMRKSKGIDVALNSITETNVNVLKELHFIFAGDDSRSIVEKRIDKMRNICSISTILRFIHDEELNYLFDKVDIVLLPYEEVSQSGILETAVYFRKVMILSDIGYFKSFANNYPSFSYIFEQGNTSKLSSIYTEICRSGLKKYAQKDIDRFYEKEAFDEFFRNFKNLNIR